MSASVTFGSVGDIITLCIIIKDLVKALDDSKGSPAQYQEVIRELWALDRVLLEVELLWRTCESTNELSALRETANRMADQCRRSIEAFLKKVKKYRPSLRDGGSGSVLKDTTMKIRWRISQADELTKFRAEINAHCSAINMLLLTASVNLNHLSEQRLHARLALGEQRMESSSKEQELLLEDVKDKLEENNKQIRAGNAVTLKISEALRLDWIRQLGNELKTFMRKIVVMNIATYKAIMDIRRCLPSHLERSLYQEPFILEDAIGRIAPVHMQFISSWEAFDSVLELRFQNMQGFKMVQNKEYVIQESATRREIGRSNAWEASFLPGQKVVMSMLFKDSASSTSSCPRCQMSSDEPQNSDVQCVGCGMWYRRITEYNDVDPSPPVSQIPLRKPREEVVVFGEASFSKIIFGPGVPEHISASKKRKREQVQNDDITLFKRVRVLSKKTRVRRIKQISGPFTGLAAARNGFFEVSTKPANDHIILKSTSSTSKQPFETFYEKQDFGRSMADTPPPTFLNTIAVPRTDSITSVDDSDDGGDDSDGGEDDSDDDETRPPILARKDQPSESVGPLHSSSSKEPNTPPSQNPKHEICESPEPLEAVPATNDTPRVDGSEDDGDAAGDDGADCADDETSPLLQAPRGRQLLEAISRGSQDQVLQFLDSGTEIGYFEGTTALCHAVQHGHEPIVHILLARGANVNNLDYAYSTALMRAAEHGNATLVSILLSHNADPEMQDVYDNTALRIAVEKGHTSTVRVLLDHGADINVKDSRGSTLLHKAAVKVDDALVLLLLQYGADVEVKDDLGQTALMLYDKHISRGGITLKQPVTKVQKMLASRKWYYHSVSTNATDSPASIDEEE